MNIESKSIHSFTDVIFFSKMVPFVRLHCSEQCTPMNYDMSLLDRLFYFYSNKCHWHLDSEGYIKWTKYLYRIRVKYEIHIDNTIGKYKFTISYLHKYVNSIILHFIIHIHIMYTFYTNNLSLYNCFLVFNMILLSDFLTFSGSWLHRAWWFRCETRCSL